MLLDSLKIPGNVVVVDGSNPQTANIFVFTLSTCMWCKLGKKWLNERGYGYSYLDIDKLPVNEKNELKKNIEELFGVKPRFPFFVVNKSEFISGYEPDIWKEKIP